MAKKEERTDYNKPYKMKNPPKISMTLDTFEIKAEKPWVKPDETNPDVIGINKGLKERDKFTKSLKRQRQPEPDHQDHSKKNDDRTETRAERIAKDALDPKPDWNYLEQKAKGK